MVTSKNKKSKNYDLEIFEYIVSSHFIINRDIMKKYI